MGNVMKSLDDNSVAKDTLIMYADPGPFAQGPLLQKGSSLSDRHLARRVTGDNGNWECKCNLTGSHGPWEGRWQKMQEGGGSSSKCSLWEAGHREVVRAQNAVQVRSPGRDFAQADGWLWAAVGVRGCSAGPGRSSRACRTRSHRAWTTCPRSQR